MKKIIVATSNIGKMREISELLDRLPAIFSSLADIWNPVPAVPETGDTFKENAHQKARWVMENLPHEYESSWVLADDSGLEVDALGGDPGVRSARFAGVNQDTAANNRKLLEVLSGVPEHKRTARFRCAAVLMTSVRTYFSAEGVCEGSIAFAQSGVGGFGYDPLFIPMGYSKSFAELDPVEKHSVSHRGKALKLIRNYCNENLP